MRKLILVSLTISSALRAQTRALAPAPAALARPDSPASRTSPLAGPLERRLTLLVDQPPFDRANWGIYVVDDRGRVLFLRPAAGFQVAERNAELAVHAVAAAALLDDLRVRESLSVEGGEGYAVSSVAVDIPGSGV